NGRSAPAATSSLCPVTKGVSGKDGRPPMTDHTSSLRGISRRESLALGAATLSVSAIAGFAPSATAAPQEKTMSNDVRPFHVSFPDSDLQDLHRRVAATRWPDKEQVADTTQGVQLATAQQLARHWATHDWRKIEAK